MWQREIALGLVTLPFWMFTLCAVLISGGATFLGTQRSLQDCELEPRLWPVWFGIAGGAISAWLVIAVLVWNSQQTPVVRPSELGLHYRILYHLLLIVLLLMITATDLRSYFILEWTCWLGICLGILGATLSGEFQLVHLWVNWNHEQPQLRGPYIPIWLAAHQHLHGVAWSLCGVLLGVILAWMTKLISTFLLGLQTLGTGDIYLMALIGAFLGWQPTLIAFAMAPLLAIVIGLALRTVSNQPALPYGPFLACGALLTLFNWRAIWMWEVPLTLAPHPDRDSIFAVRRFFGDWVSLIATGGLAVLLFVVLLGLLRIYKSIELKQ